ncbi:MAG: DEAD/DEAH box helicase [Gammaproteobacteria bacterium]|nr:DEAD/DEAH box helicase [Gammaproteobacteria bacterium]
MTINFDSLNLSPAVLKAVQDAGYEAPSPIQAECIPHLIEGKDLLGQAQTGTGKTAAFALPLLSRIDLKQKDPQILVLAPTRELAIQVAEAFQAYARHMKNFHVLPIYGGQAYGNQLRQLKHGAHVVVGTPGRVMDHIGKGTLKLDGLKTLVLDEADEMLRMGFIDDVEWILGHTPKTRQIALFSATMPAVIKKVAQKYLNNPELIKIESKTSTASNIRQRYWKVSGIHKLDALTRIMEMEEFDGMIIFVRTKTATIDLAERLSARGHACEALNGDIAQNSREKIVDRLRKGKLDVLIATDVVARGLDVERISHVVNYDIPYDTESYVHRIGRTGRAGRKGDAILFIAPREQRQLTAIERATNQKIEPMQLPTASDINKIRVGRFKQKVVDALAVENLEFFYQLMTEVMQEQTVEPLEIAAALAHMVQGDDPLLLTERPQRTIRESRDNDRDRGRDREPRKSGRDDREGRGSRGDRELRNKRNVNDLVEEANPLKDFPTITMKRFRVDVGHDQNVKPGNLVGAIANEGDIDSCYIGDINIYDNFSTVDLPDEIPGSVLNDLKKTRVAGHKLEIREYKKNEKSKPGAGSNAPGKRKPKSGDKSGEKAKPRSKPGEKPKTRAKSGDKPPLKRKPKPKKATDK